MKRLKDILKLPEKKSVKGTQANGMRIAYENCGYNKAIDEIGDMRIHRFVSCARCGDKYLHLRKVQMELEVCPKCEKKLMKEIEQERKQKEK